LNHRFGSIRKIRACHAEAQPFELARQFVRFDLEF
jgi:hypothetical protein